jgi:hypothetical protein
MVVLGLPIEQLRMVSGNGIRGTFAERRQAVNEEMAEASSLGWGFNDRW